MTECARLLRLLARRVRATRLYEVDDPTETSLLVKLEDAVVLVHAEEDGGRAKEAFSFLTRNGSVNTVHLNQWYRGDVGRRRSVPDLATDLWRAFWEHEVENRTLGRVQWMHGPDLPWLDEDVEVQLDLPFDEPPAAPPADEVLAANVEVDAVAELLESVVEGPPSPPPPRQPILDVLDILDW